MSKKKIVIIGGGFAGLNLAKKLDKKLYDITLIDKNNYNQFQPLIYQVVVGGIETAAVMFPFRSILYKHQNINYINARLLSIDSKNNKVNTNIGEYEYDYLILANGAKTNFYGNENLQKNAFSMKSARGSYVLHNHILKNLEKLSQNNNNNNTNEQKNIVIVGGGSTGVEISGALSEFIKKVVNRYYPEIKNKINIHLISSSERVLPVFSEKSSLRALKTLNKLKVNVHLGTKLDDYIDNKAILSNNETIETNTVVWVSGISVEKIEGLNDNIYSRANRILVDEYSKINGYKNIYAIGDISLMQTDDYPNGHPQVAQVAMQQAKRLAKNFNSTAKQKQKKKFEYTDLGSMAVIGRSNAVVEIKGMKFKGLIAMGIWFFIHILQLNSWHNRFQIIIDWILYYFTYDCSLQVIFKPRGRDKD